MVSVFQGRQTRRGKGKGRRKGTGKGKGGRRFFRSRKRMGKRKKERPLSHAKEKGMKEMNGRIHGMKAIGSMIRTGRLLGLWRSVLHGWVWIFPEERKRKGKERQQRQGWWRQMGKTRRWKRKIQCSTSDLINSCFAELQNQQQQAHYSSAESRSGHGFLAFAETYPARVDVLTATYEEQEYKRRTRRVSIWVAHWLISCMVQIPFCFESLLVSNHEWILLLDQNQLFSPRGPKTSFP